METHVNKKRITPAVALLFVALLLMIIAAIATPNLLRSRIAADSAVRHAELYKAQEQAGFGDYTRASAEPQSAPFADPVRFAERQVIQTIDMSLLVDDPGQAAEQASAIAAKYRGYVENSQVGRAGSGSSAQVTLRVPSVSVEEARLALRRLAKKVEEEKASANDVTAQVADVDATLRNYRAEEQQYLAIMQRSGSVKDTLEVAQRLAEVRGRIERTEAQLKLMSRQVEMATIHVSLRAEAIVSPAEIKWLPNFRAAWRDAAESMAAYLATLTAMVLYMPVVLAWVATILFLLVIGWRVSRWVWMRWFVVAPLPRA